MKWETNKQLTLGEAMAAGHWGDEEEIDDHNCPEFRSNMWQQSQHQLRQFKNKRDGAQANGQREYTS